MRMPAPLRVTFPIMILGIVGACSEPVTPEASPSLRFAKATAGPTVKAALPASAPRNITLDVQITGTGFENGSIARWLLNGAEDLRVRTNETRFVSSTSIVANITISPDAEPSLYDIAVITPLGKRGIGTEKFTVLAMEQLYFGSGNASAQGVNAEGKIVGSAPGGCDDLNLPVIWVNLEMRSLPLPPGLCRGFARDINDAGQILGRLFAAGATSLTQAVPVIWTPDGDGYTVRDLGLAQDGSRPYEELGFNSQGHAVANIMYQAYWWSEATGWLRLPEAPGSNGCYAYDVNDVDEIAGLCRFDGPDGKYNSTTVYWASPTSAPELLPRIPGYNYAHSGRSINNSGAMVGTAVNNKHSNLLISGILWTKSSGLWAYEIMPSMGGTDTTPNEINDDGWVVGSGKVSGGKTRAILWKSGQPMRDLGAIGPESWAYGISPSGAVETLVVGQTVSGNVNRAVVWRPFE
jgi:probable HAF family extracellular repeat protein